MPDGEIERTVAECLTCGSAYAARKWSDGTIQPIGRGSCQCGSTQFRVLKDTNTPALRKENIK